MKRLPERPPLSALLSPVVVAFQIECDNQFERRMPHRTTDCGASGGADAPWLASMTMWWTCLRFVPPEGIPVEELVAAARMRTNFKGMVGWGYITVRAEASGVRMVRATANGRKAQELWRGLAAEIEERWKERCGAAVIGRLREALAGLLMRIPFELADCLPILGYGLFVKGRVKVRRAAPPRREAVAGLALPVLLARVLLAFALDFERESPLSLAVYANVLRILNPEGVEVRRIPALSGVSKEAVEMASGILRKQGLAEVGTPGRFRVARLTAKGVAAQEQCRRRLVEIEEQWAARFGGAIGELREALAGIEERWLWAAVEANAGWRASVPKPEALPRFPMVLHRGGYPDGS